ncbi:MULTISPECIES: hypothetical protein [Enterococcus]|uniref:hypothetical protein n=1 Tax=Enterococcus TaxID=1350 RepID=UPI0011604DB0|nr:hypothetical protein [Enterococcus casseliflavus]
MKGNSIKEMKKKNPNLFKESWVRKQARLAQEEQERLDKAVVKRDRPVCRDGELIKWQDGEVIN